jgi:hypothetical protein
MSQFFSACCTGFDREFFGSAPSSLDRPLTHAVTFTDLLAALVKNILSLSRVSFVLFRKPVLLQVRDALPQSPPASLILEEDCPPAPSTPHAAP